MNSRSLFALPCEASSLRGKLKHSYLENAVSLPTLGEDLVESMIYRENGIPRHQVIRRLIRELLELMSNPDQGFSPAQLVDRLPPFRQLAADKKEALKEQIHGQFCEEFRLVERSRRLEESAAEFLGVLDEFLAQSPVALSESKIAMEKTQKAARKVIRELEDLPKGIWLWKSVRETFPK